QEGPARIVDPCYTAERPGGGTGLGLSICTAILREHGGTIEAQSWPAGGSAFSVVLPAVSAEQEMAAADPPAPADAAPSAPLRTPAMIEGRRVLVLDDEESI